MAENKTNHIRCKRICRSWRSRAVRCPRPCHSSWRSPAAAVAAAVVAAAAAVAVPAVDPGAVVPALAPCGSWSGRRRRGACRRCSSRACSPLSAPARQSELPCHAGSSAATAASSGCCFRRRCCILTWAV